MDVQLNFLEIFIPPTAGAIFTMAIFYFASETLMNRAVRKKQEAILKAEELGIPIKIKKKFTFANKKIVQIKMKLGVYGVLMLAPLFLSIPLGSVICAKFYRHHKKTFPIMVGVISAYSALMASIIVLFAQ